MGALVLAWLFVRSPAHRVPVGICLSGQFVCRVAYLLQENYRTPDPRIDLKILGLAFTGIAYALALFRFRMFHLIPIARGTLVEQIPEGMLVLDLKRRIVDLNPAAEKILGVAAVRARGMDAFSGLPLSLTPQKADSEITLGAGNAERTYGVHVSALTSSRGHLIGPEQRRAQGQLIEQQRALATLRERDRVARELQDTWGSCWVMSKCRQRPCGDCFSGDNESRPTPAWPNWRW